MATTADIETHLADQIRQLMENRDDSPAVHGPWGSEPAWVQPECAFLLEVVNEIRAGNGLEDTSIEDILREEYAAATARDVDYAQDLARRLAALATGEDD